MNHEAVYRTAPATPGLLITKILPKLPKFYILKKLPKNFQSPIMSYPKLNFVGVATTPVNQ